MSSLSDLQRRLSRKLETGRGVDEDWWQMYERHARAAIIRLDQVRGK